MDRIAQLEQFLKEDPNDSFVQHALALEYLKLGDDDKALQLFQELLSKNPDYLGSYYHLAKVLQRKGETENAIKWYQKGMQKAKEQNNGHAYNELMAAYEDLVY